MKVCEAINEIIAIELWLNGDELNKESFLDFIPKIGKNPRNEALKNYRRAEKYHKGKSSQRKRHHCCVCGFENCSWCMHNITRHSGYTNNIADNLARDLRKEIAEFGY